MFLNFYGLSEQPFGVTPDPEYLYLSATHREALASIAYGVQAGVGFATVIAKPGMGKTTLLFALLRHFQGSAQSAFLFDTQCNSKELLQNLLDEFKIREEGGKNSMPPLALLRQFLLKNARTDQPVLLIVDEAQNLDIPVFETLRLLSNFETPHAKLLHIVLSGQPELARKLTLPELEQLRQRIAIVSRLDAFVPADVIQYIAHRLKRAGYQGNPPFTPEALGILVEKAHGIPREINRLCFNALSLGCAVGKNPVDGQLMREAAEDLEISASFNKAENDQGNGLKTLATDELAALFSVALRAPSPLKEHTDHIAPEPKLKKAEVANTIALEGESLRPAAVLLAEQAKLWRKGQAGNAIPSDALISAEGPRTAKAATVISQHVPAQDEQKAPHGQQTLNMSPHVLSAGAAQPSSTVQSSTGAQPSPVGARRAPAIARRSRRVGFFGTVWPWSLPMAAVIILGGLIWSSSVRGGSTFASSDMPEDQTIKLEARKTTSANEKTFSADDPQRSFVKVLPLAHARLGFNSTEASLISPHAASATSDAEENKIASASNDTSDDKAAKISALDSATPSTSAAVKTAPWNSVPTPQSRLKIPSTNELPGVLKGASTTEIAAMTRSDTATRIASGNAAAPASPMVIHETNSAVPETTLTARLVMRVDPVYPEAARNRGIAGSVVLDAHIDEAGRVQQLRAITGDPLLVRAATDAVRQWEYQPPFVNGQPQQSDTRITINFSLR